MLKNLLSSIQQEILDETRPLLVMTFITGTQLYIRYNDYNEYSYQIQFTQEAEDRIRFDNFDNRWNIISRPHHLHRRREKVAVESPTNGDPTHDIPILITYYLSKLLGV